MKNCIFCQIINKREKDVIRFENESCIVFEPIEPIAKGHVLIVPKKHFQDIFDIDAKILSELAIVSQKSARDTIKKFGATGVNLLHASGKDAQQSISHFHIHLVPRYPNDGLDLWLKNKL